MNRGFGLAGLIIAMWVGLPSTAQADQWGTALRWKCDERLQQLTVFPHKFNLNEPHPVSQRGLYVQSEDRLAPAVPNEVLSCALSKGRGFSLYRIKQHAPSPRGACGGQAWAKYDLRLNDRSVASFHLGCGDVFLIADQKNLALCPMSFACKTYKDAPLRINLFGQWIEE